MAAKMSWHCRNCNIPNSLSDDHCKSCQEHWQKAWQQPKRRSGSRTKSAQRQEKTKDKKAKKDQPAKTTLDLGLTPGRTPWVPSTPQGRLTGRQIELNKDEEPALPPQPVLPPPPQAPQEKENLTEEETKVLAHLRGLVKLNCPLPAELQAQLAHLEQKDKVVPSALSHGQLNKLKRVQNQLQGIGKKIAQVDTDWRHFVQAVTNHVQEHGGWYQAHRQDLLNQYNMKAEELEMAKREVSQASSLLVEKTAETTTTVPEGPEVAVGIAAISQTLAHAAGTQFQALEVLSEEEPMDTGPGEDGNGQPEGTTDSGEQKARRTIRPQPFSASRSPQRVAQHILKK